MNMGSLDGVSRMRSARSTSSLSEKLVDSMRRESLPGNTFKGSVLLFCNGLIGAGAVSLPHAMIDMGVVIGFIFIGFMALGSVLSSWMLVECSDHTSCDSYLSLASVVGGPCARYLALISLCIFCLGSSCAFLSVIMTSMPAVFKSVLCYSGSVSDHLSCEGSKVIRSILLQEDTWIVVYAVGVIFPLLILASSSDKFKIVQSATALFGNSYLICVTCGRFYFGHYKLNWSQVLHNLTTNHLNLVHPTARVVLAASIVMQCFSTHWIVFPLYHQLQRSSADRFVRVSKLSIVLAMTLYEGVAVLGYLTWLDQATPNVLENYSHEDFAMNVARVMLTVSVTTGAVLNLGSVADLIAGEFFSKRLQTIIQVILLAMALAVALWVPGVDLLFAITGSIAGSAINFIMPSIFLLHLQLGTPSMRTSAYVLLCVGILIGVGGPITILKTKLS